MKYRTAVAVGVILCIAGWVAAQPTYAFADLSWGSGPQSVITALESRGYGYEREMEHGTLLFKGRLFNREAWVYAGFSGQGELGRVMVFIRHGDVSRARRFFEAEETWNDVKRVLTERYGPARTNYDFFMDPYYRGDGYETQAVELEKAHFASFWAEASDGSSLATLIDSDVDVAVLYEGPAWGAELDRRRSVGTDDF